MEEQKFTKEELAALREKGFLINRGTRCFSGRVITGFGRLDGEKLAAVGQAARQFGDGNVSLTTRLTLEVTGIPYEAIEPFRAFLREHGLTTGGSGNHIEAIVACKATTCRFGMLDSYAIGKELYERFFLGYREVTLPKKFKIAVGGCPNNCAKPDLNDVGITAWRHGYKISVGGRWGHKRIQGKTLEPLFEDLEAVMTVVENAILLYKEQGLPTERFADTVERLGFETVQAQLLSEELQTRKHRILTGAAPARQ